MSLYTATMQQGAAIVIDGYFQSKEGARNAYNKAYADAQRRTNVQNAKIQAERNISKIKQDSVLSNVQIQLQQRQAEADIISSAATAGVKGGSVDNVIYGTESSAAMARSRVNAEADQAIDYQKAAVSSQQATLLALESPKDKNYLGIALGSLAEGISNRESLLNENVGNQIDKLWSN